MWGGFRQDLLLRLFAGISHGQNAAWHHVLLKSIGKRYEHARTALLLPPVGRSPRLEPTSVASRDTEHSSGRDAGCRVCLEGAARATPSAP
jgi:hypothetical protein